MNERERDSEIEEIDKERRESERERQERESGSMRVQERQRESERRKGGPGSGGIKQWTGVVRRSEGGMCLVCAWDEFSMSLLLLVGCVQPEYEPRMCLVCT